MAGRKPCLECERKLPVATKICECGFAFISVKKCKWCGEKAPIAKKQCDCGQLFKQSVSPGFKEMPVVLTSDRLRPRRVRMKCQIYDEGDFIYNVSMSALPRHGRFPNGKTYDKHDDMYDKDLNDAALESIANSIITNNSKSKENLETMYLKRERTDSSDYTFINSLKNEKPFTANNIKTELNENTEHIIENLSGSHDSVVTLGSHDGVVTLGSHDSVVISGSQDSVVTSGSHDSVVTSSHTQIDTTPLKKPKTLLSGKISPRSNGLTDLIRGEVSKAIKKKLLHGSPAGALSPPLASACKDRIKCIKEEVLSDSEYDEDDIALSDLFLSRKPDSSMTTTSAGKSNGLSGVPLIAGLPGYADIEKQNRYSYSNGTLSGVEDIVKLDRCFRIHDGVPDVIPKTILEQPVKKKLGRPRKHPLQEKGPMGRPRKHLVVEKKVERKNDAMNVAQDVMNVAQEERDSYMNMNASSSSDTSITPIKRANNTSLTPIKRGRPKGCKDSKPRKARNDYIVRLIERNENVDEVLSAKKSVKTLKGPLGRPSLMASAKAKEKQHIENRKGSLNAEEIENIEHRLNKTNPWIIPDHKTELYSLILGEINRRITSQGFHSTLT